ncbi:MAG: gamma-glutamyltransferase [Chloroflexia bacterium]|nr:gamma-glutamyltransferase [Chloroflexia bacterium]
MSHTLQSSVPEYMRDGSTTHLSTADRFGNVVSITQTLLNAWGSRVVAPGTGVLLNNGMMWFDPEPGRPNSVAGGKRPLSNMAPLIVQRNGSAFATLGSSGGRKIAYCNAQLVMNLIDHGLPMQAAIEAPRFDTSTPALQISDRIPPETLDALVDLGHQVAPVDETLLLGSFASPVGISRDEDGSLNGGADPFYFPATVGVPNS